MRTGKTQSVCPVCLTKIPAYKVVGGDGNIYMETGMPDIGLALITLFTDRAADPGHNSVSGLSVIPHAFPRFSQVISFCVMQEFLECLQTVRRCIVHLDLSRIHAGEDQHLHPGPGECHIQRNLGG